MPVEVIFFNVGQGDCTFLWFYEVVGGGGGGGVSPLANRQGVAAALIDCGAKPAVAHHSTVGQPGTAGERMVGHIRDVITDRLGRNAGAAKDRLDYLFLSHSDADHYNKLGDLLWDTTNNRLRFGIENVWYTGEPKDYHRGSTTSFMYQLLQQGQLTKNPPEAAGLYSDVMPFDIAPHVSGLPELSLICSSLFAEVVNKKKKKKEVSRTEDRPSTWKNAASLVFMLTGTPAAGSNHRQKVLLMADAERGVEEFLMGSDLMAHTYQRESNLWLKAGHHGSEHASSPDWVAYTSPDAVFISSGTGVFNGTGMPTESHLNTIRPVLGPKPVILPQQQHDYASFVPNATPSEFVVHSTQDGICTTMTTYMPPTTPPTKQQPKPKGEWLGTDWHLILDDPQPGKYHLECN
ncbi:ComEC/Rec2 family competence protein [Streptomyces sp. UNOC14_S4]|uniref:ComEC/Rec2 family competence protein n=1 Tax=Streptomyces sp. UNOC14_S4 TaxID=2872340 RepID=UPI001E465C95|nr:hypothetical protein [Streptomyces sp. UNOC14_S4]MCC3772385.1 hypothetical protein [Streptomyces sp. UNOC14_S4]